MPTRIVRKAIATVKQFTAWSFSRWKDYQQCPALAKYKHIDKMKEPEHPASARGNAVHEEADNYLKGKIKKLSSEFKHFKKDMARLLKLKATAEEQWAFTRDWDMTTWFNMDKAWLRIKVDSHYLEEKRAPKHANTKGTQYLVETTVVIIDYKTGKIREQEHKGQRSLYALGAMVKYPDAQHVVVQHWYLDSGEMHEDTFEAADLDELKEYWVNQTVIMFRDKRFAPKPGNHCRWCHFSKGKAGPCRY